MAVASGQEDCEDSSLFWLWHPSR